MTKIASLTGIRGFLALWVVLYHVSINPHFNFLNLSFLIPFVNKGYLAVDLFFILSGFVIAFSYQKDFLIFHPTRLARFYLLRLVRILPVHYGVLVLFLFTVSFAGCVENHSWAHAAADYSTWGLICNFLNIQAWETLTRNNWNAPAWSISAEFFAYLIFPFIGLPLSRLQNSYLNAAIIVSMLSLLRIVCHCLQLPDLNWTYHLGLIRVLCEFISGCCLYNLVNQIRYNGSFATILHGLVLMTILLSVYYQANDVWIVILFFPFLYFLGHEKGQLNKLFSNAKSVWLGEISYALYMVHTYVLLVLRSIFIHLPWLQNPIAGWGLLMFTIMSFAYLIYHFVENPARK